MNIRNRLLTVDKWALHFRILGRFITSAKNLKAIDNTRKAIVILTALNDFNGLGEAHDNLGMIYREQKIIPRQRVILIKLWFSMNRRVIRKNCRCLSQCRNSFPETEKYKNALNYLERSIEIRQQFGSKIKFTIPIALCRAYIKILVKPKNL